MLRALGPRAATPSRSLRGMFAFASWDPTRRRLLLARDPLGIKPLYFARRNHGGGEWSLAFASEVRALLASGLLGQPRLDPVAAASVVWNGFVAGPHTAVVGVELLWPGQLRIFDAARRRAGVAAVLERSRPGRLWRRWTRTGSPRRWRSACACTWSATCRWACSSPAASTRRWWRTWRRRRTAAPCTPSPSPSKRASSTRGPTRGAIARAIGTEHREVVLRREGVRRESWTRRSTAWTSPPSTASTPTSCRTPSARPASPSRWWAPAATSSSAATPRSAICRRSCAGRGGWAGCRADRWSPRPGSPRRACSAPGAVPAQTAGPSCPRWCGAETTSSRSTSLPTRSSCPTSSPP